MYKPTTQTTFSLLCGVAGLSLAEAAVVLGVPTDTVRSWSSGRRRHPPEVLDDLRRHVLALEARAEDAIGWAKSRALETVTLRVPDDDAEAVALGWRSQAEWRAYAGRVVLRSYLPVTLRPYGMGA